MKILFVGDASNLHNSLAQALLRMGHTAVVASNGSRWMNTHRDIDLQRRPGKIGALRYAADILRALPSMRGYDVVHISNPIFLQLRPGKIKPIFDYLKRNNRHIVLSALGTDYNYYQACHDGHTFRYSDYMVGNRPSPYTTSTEAIAQNQSNWETEMMRRYSDYITSNIDGAVACLYEYYVTYLPILGKRVAYAGIPIDTDSLEPSYIDKEPERVRFFIGMQRDRTVVKGTDRLLAAAKQLAQDYQDKVKLDVVENLPYDEYVRSMRQSHVLLDQIYSYTPATNALLAMAQGMVVVSGAEPEYYELIGESENHPIVNVSPAIEGDIYNKLQWIVTNKNLLPELSRRSREFVVKHNNSTLVAQRHIDFWKQLDPTLQ